MLDTNHNAFERIKVCEHLQVMLLLTNCYFYFSLVSYTRIDVYCCKYRIYEKQHGNKSPPLLSRLRSTTHRQRMVCHKSAQKTSMFQMWQEISCKETHNRNLMIPPWLVR